MHFHTGSKVAACLFLFVVVPVAFAEEPAIPSCTQPFGTLALREPEQQNYWWLQYDLANPEALLKLYVNESGCFIMVDRGEGLEMSLQERDLAGTGELQVDSNMGKGQMLAADFFLVPDLIAKDSNSGGNALGGAIAGEIGGKFGALIGGVKTKKLEADTILTLINARTGVQTATARGQAGKTDVSFGAGGLLGGVLGAGGGYADTEIGRLIATAYAKAYTDLVAKVKQRVGAADSSAPIPAYQMALDTELYSQPSRGDSVRKLRSGMNVYPTGKRDGAFMEVKDKFGTIGWVSVEDLR